MQGAAVEIALHVACDHPALEGHFPGRPIVPGVVLLSEALAVIESVTSCAPEEWVVAHAKFLAPVAPGTPLTLVHEASASGAVRFEIRSAERCVASGLLSPRGDRGPR